MLPDDSWFPRPSATSLGSPPARSSSLAAVNGALEVRVPSRVRIEDGPHGPHFAADGADELTDEHVRELIEKTAGDGRHERGGGRAFALARDHEATATALDGVAVLPLTPWPRPTRC